VPALLVFCSSLFHKIECSVKVNIKMPQVVSKLKADKLFSIAVYLLGQTLCCLAPTCLFHLFFLSSCDIVQAWSYFTSTVLILGLGTRWKQVVSIMPQPCFTPRERTLWLYRRLGGPQSYSGYRLWKESPLS
jgi:hypothetical protein